MNIWSKLKNRWGVDSDLQAIIILCTFALTGFSTLFVHNYIDHLLGIDAETSFWIKLPLFIFIILPIFSALLYVWGNILGQRKFVTQFIRYKIDFILRKKDK